MRRIFALRPTVDTGFGNRALASFFYLLFFVLIIIGSGIDISAQYPSIARPETPLVRIAPDRRVIAETKKFPFSAVVKIKVTFPDGSTTWGTGAFIDSDKVVTADHVIHDAASGKDASRIEILPGYADGDTTCNPTIGVSWSHGSHDGCHDGALCDVAVITTRDKAGCKTGWFGFKKYDDVSLSGIFVAGYPQDLSPNGEKMYVLKTNAEISQSGSHNILRYKDWTAPGMSGGPIFTSDYYIIGVHSAGGEDENYGVAFCNQLYAAVKNWWNLDNTNFGDSSPTRRNY